MYRQIDYPPPMTHEPSGNGWQARLELGYQARAGQTVPVHRRHVGPLRVQRAFHPEGPVCHSYLLHPPGGIVGGDSLHIDVAVAPGAHALITTPAANKFYRSGGDLAQQTQSLRVDGALEWLPQEQIVFSGARVRSDTHIQLGESARFLGWEINALGRPARDERFETGLFRQRVAIHLGERPLLLDRGRYDGGAAVLDAVWGLAGHSAFGTLWMTPAPAGWREQLTGQTLPAAIACTEQQRILVVRAVAHETMHIRAAFIRVRALLRERVFDLADYQPRIWAT